MGIYTSNNNYFGRDVYDYAAEIPANEAYDAAFGCAHVLADCQANDMALFESTIYSDMNEVMAVQEGVQVVNENAFTNVIKKIVEMFKKLIAKIKGIFKAFLAKLSGMFKSGKDLVKKYEKQILKYSNWKSFKIKGIRRPKNKGTDIVASINTAFSVASGAKTITGTDSRYKLTANGALAWTCDIPKANSTPKDIKDADAEDIREALLKKYVSGVTVGDYKDFSEDMTDHLYDEEDTIDGDDDNISSSFFTSAWIKGVLEDKKLITDAEKLNKKIDDYINYVIDSLEKTHTDLAKWMTTDGNKGKEYAKSKSELDLSAGNSGISKDSHFSKKGMEWEDDTEITGVNNTPPTHTGSKIEDIQAVIVAMQKIASNEQEVVTKVTGEYMTQLKFAVTQARKLWTAAAAYTSTEHKEDASYYQAVGECAAEQAYQKFESIH